MYQLILNSALFVLSVLWTALTLSVWDQAHLWTAELKYSPLAPLGALTDADVTARSANESCHPCVFSCQRNQTKYSFKARQENPEERDAGLYSEKAQLGNTLVLLKNKRGFFIGYIF